MTTEKLMQLFQLTYGADKTPEMYFAPGRVNLIGEHTDHNGGHVFPCALTIGTYGAITTREDRVIRFYSANFPGIVETSLDDLTLSKEAGWTNYPKGVMWTFEKRGYKIPCGTDILIYGDIPNGSGLSSSASLEVLTGVILKDLYEIPELTMTDLALIGQYSENNFNGCNCGIMDQFASAMGKQDNAIFLDTATLNYTYAPVKLSDARIVITNSKVKHSLVSSAYNDRRRECEEALNAGDLEEFGRLINASHVSLRDDYETSCEETDLLASLAWEIPGVLGSRITGGGFGGCTVSIVKNDAIDTFTEKIGPAYEKATGHKAEFYLVDIGDGAHKLN